MASPRAPLLRPIHALFLTVFLDLLGFGMILPILALYAKSFHVSDVAVTFLGASYSLMQFGFAPIWGRVSDRFGRRPVLLVSILGSCLSQLGYAIAPSFAGLLVARCVAGVCGANIAVAQAYMADTTDEKSRAAGMARLGIALGLGFVFGPFFGGILGRHDPKLPFLIASGLALANLIFAAAVLREPTVRKAGTRTVTWAALAETVSQPRLRVLIILFFVVTFGFANLEGTFPLYLERRFQFGREQVGYVFGVVGVLMVIVQGGLVRPLVTRFGERRLVVAGTAIMALGMMLNYFGHSLTLLGASLVCVAVGNGINNPSLSSLLSRAAGSDRQGGVLGVAQSFGALGRIFGPITGGYLLRFGEGTPYLSAGIILAVACGWAAVLVRQPESPTEAAPVAAKGNV